MGISAAFAYIGLLALAKAWFNPRTFRTINGLTISISTIGAMLGTTWVAVYVTQENWREIIRLSAFIPFFIAILMYLVVRDKPNKSAIIRSNLTIHHMALNFLIVIRNAQVWLLGIYGGLMFTLATAFAGFWCMPFFALLYGSQSEMYEYGPSFIYLGIFVGASFIVWLSNIWDNYLIMRWYAFLSALVMLTILYVPNIPFPLMCLLLILLGVLVPAFLLPFVLAPNLASKKVTASVFALVNILEIGFSTLTLQLIGFLLEIKTDNIHALKDYQIALSVIPIGLFGAIILTYFMRTSQTSNDA